VEIDYDNVDYRVPLRRPLSRRKLSALISSLWDDIRRSEKHIELSEKDIEQAKKGITDCRNIARDIQREYAERPEYLGWDESDVAERMQKVDSLTAQYEEIIAASKGRKADCEEMNEVRRKTLAEAEEMLRQMSG
jgi:hypothetical protein